MARKKHQYFWVIETFSTDSTFELTGFHGAQRSENPVQRFVGGVLKVH